MLSLLSLVRMVGDPVYLVIALVWLGVLILVGLSWGGWCAADWARRRKLSVWLSRPLGVAIFLVPLELLAAAGVWLLRQDPLIIEWVILVGLLAAAVVWIVLAVRSFVKKRPVWQRVLAFAVWLIPLGVTIGWWGYFAQQAEAFAEFRQPGVSVIIRLDQRGRPMITNEHPLKTVVAPTDPGDYLLIRPDRRMFIFHLPEGFTKQGQRQPGMLYFTGSDESAPWQAAFAQTRFSHRWRPPDSLPDRISLYLISRCQYSYFGERRYAWNSSLGSLSPYNGRNDDAQFAVDARNWMIDNLGLDENRLTVVGFSDGAVTAAEVVLAGLFPVYRFVSLGGTAFDSKLKVYSKAKGLKEVVVQLNNNDDTTLPNDKDGKVVKGTQYVLAILAGYRKIRYSKPRLQVKIWQDYFSGEGGDEQKPTYYSGRDWQGVVNTFRMLDGSESQLIVLSVEGGHAVHGSPGGGSPDDGIFPNMNVDLIAFLAYRMAGRPLSECFMAIAATKQIG